MLVFVRRAALCASLTLCICVCAAPTASANLAPASTSIMLPVFGTGFTFIYAGIPIVCTAGTLAGVTPSTGVSSLSTTLALGAGCTALGVIAVTASCRGHITWRLTAYSSPSGAGNVSLDLDFECTFNLVLAGCRISIVGAQSNVGSWDFTNMLQRFRATLTAVAATDSGGMCSGNTFMRTRRATGAITGTFVPSTRLTVS